MGPEVALGMQGVSTVLGAVGGMQSGQASSAAAKYQAQVARNNAQIAQQNAEYASQAGETAAQTQDLKNRATQGSIAAAQSASGLSFDSPSLVDVRSGAAQIGRLDTANVAQNAALRTRRELVQAGYYESEAGLQERKASDATTAGTMTAFGSLLSGGAAFADKWNKFYPPATKAV